MQVGYSNSVEYALVSDTLGRVVIPEPINYDKGIGNIYERDKDSKGFLKTKSNDLEFYGEAREKLILQIVAKGLSEDILLQRNIKDKYRLDERWKTVSETYLDMGELTYDEKTAKVKATQGGLFKVLDSKKSDEYDLMDNTSINGVDIGNLNRVQVPVDGRDILRISEMSVEDGTRIAHPVTFPDTTEAKATPFKVDVNSDAEDIFSTTPVRWGIASGTWAVNSPVTVLTGFWYSNADQSTKLILNGRIELRIVDTPHPGTLTLDLIRYVDNGGTGYTRVGNPVTLDTISTSTLGNTAFFDFINYEIEVSKGEFLAFGAFSDTQDGIKYEYYNTQLEIREDSTYPASNVLGVTYKTLAERLVAKITGETDCVESSLFEPGGLWEGHVVTQGFWAREFPDIIQEGTDEERKIQFTTSLKDFLAHLYAIKPIAWWVDKRGNKEILRIELLSYTQQNFIGIKFATFSEDQYGRKRVIYIQANNIKRKTLKDNFWSTIILGSELGGDGFEEVAGLQSICGQASWATINNKNTSEYKRLSPYALGDIPVELARRRPFSDFPDVDSKYDSWKMLLDCKKIGNGYYLKKWQDIFETAPKNVYRVDTAFNLEWTPAQLFLNHSSEINIGLYHNSTASVYFNSSNCNSSFISKKSGEDELREDAPIPHSRLDKPRVKPTSVDFDLEVDDELEAQIIGQTDGTPNWFGLAAVETGDGIEYMRLVKTDTNKEGKHKLVEAYT